MIFLIYAAVLFLFAASVGIDVRYMDCHIVRSGKLDAFLKAEGSGFQIWVDGHLTGVETLEYYNAKSESPRFNDLVSLGIIEHEQYLLKGLLNDVQLQRVIFCHIFFKFFIGWSFLLIMVLGIKKRADLSNK